jgi:PAS domain S-box-containing protein
MSGVSRHAAPDQRTARRRAAGAPEFAPLAVVDAFPNAVIAVDPDGAISYANTRVESVFGYRPAELLGQPVEVLLPERVRQRHVSHREGFTKDPAARPMGMGRELAARRKDGSEFPVEISLSPVIGASGLRVFATVVDITERKAADAALADSERRFRAVLDASPNAIVAVDGAGSIGYANPRVEEVFGYRPEELLGQPLERLLPDRVQDRHVAHRQSFADQPTARPMGIGLDLAARRKDGSEFPVEISLSPVESAAGVQVFATVVDITERKAAEAELLQAQKLESIGRLAGGVAHDFNNMLFAINGYCELLDEDLAKAIDGHFDVDLAQRSVGAIAGVAERGARLTAQLLAFSRQPGVSERVVDPNEAVRSLEPMLERLIGSDVQLQIRLDPAVGRIKVDPGRLDQILVNLVVNARDAMPDGGTVRIETSMATFDERDRIAHRHVEAGEYVLLTVADTGAGMDAETRERAFEPFFTTKDQGKGTGLGLATIYGSVVQAGGHIWLYSEPGLGSTFKLYFPRVDAPLTPTPARSEEPLPTRSGTVLLVEDDDAVRDMTRQLLERAGYRVIAVGDGPAAVEAAQMDGTEVDVLVSDVVMPSMSGVQLAEWMKRRRPWVGIVLLSGYTAESLDLQRAQAAGARFVTKPVASRDLLRAVSELIVDPAGPQSDA